MTVCVDVTVSVDGVVVVVAASLAVQPITNANTNDVLDDVVPDDDGAGPFCSWSESVCVMPVTHYVTEADGGQLLFCARHYLAHLLHLDEVHVPTCSGWMAEHIIDFGEIGKSHLFI